MFQGGRGMRKGEVVRGRYGILHHPLNSPHELPFLPVALPTLSPKVNFLLTTTLCILICMDSHKEHKLEGAFT